MLIYFILLLGTLLVSLYSIHDRLRSMQRTQQFHTQWLQELMVKIAEPMMYRKFFQSDADTPTLLHPIMLVPYVTVMTEGQNQRYRQWLLASQHEPFTVEEIRALEKSLAATASI
jgi:hypothetical protein